MLAAVQREVNMQSHADGVFVNLGLCKGGWYTPRKFIGRGERGGKLLETALSYISPTLLLIYYC